MDLKGKRLLILGGARLSCEIVKHAKALGIVTAVTDFYPMEKCPAKQEADEAYFEDTSDTDAMAAFIREKKFDGVITGFTDSVLPYYAEMCEKAGLPSYGTKEQFDIFIDKKKYKTLLREFNIPTIPEYQCDTDADIVYPVIVKPSESSGARGITICYTAEELKPAIDYASRISEDNAAIVERYIDEPEATIFWLFVNGQYYLMTIGNRHVKHNQDGAIPLPVGYTYPSSVIPMFQREIAPKMEKMFRSVGIKDGMMFMQCKIVERECWVYDIGFRLTGSLEYINIKSLCGYDPLDMMIHFALTGDMGEPKIASKIDPYLNGAYAYNVSLLCKPGKIAKITGIEEIEKIPGLIETVVAHPEGDEISESMKGQLAQVTVRALGKAASIRTMRREMIKIHNAVHIISEEGDEMLLPGLEESDWKLD